MLKNLLMLGLMMLFVTMIVRSQEDKAREELDEVKRLTLLTDEHYFLHSFAGSWKLKGLNYSDEGESPISGEVEINKIMNGHYIEILLKTNYMGLHSLTRMDIGYDTRYSYFTLTSIDDMMNYGINATGKRAGNKLVFTGKALFIFMDEDIEFKIEIERVRDNKITYMMYYKTGNKYSLMSEYFLIKR